MSGWMGGWIDGRTGRQADAIIHHNHALNCQTFRTPLQFKTGVKLVTEAHFVATVRVVISLFFEMTLCYYASILFLQYDLLRQSDIYMQFFTNFCLAFFV